jgi:Mrp family chromosome partitioning ATPase
VQRSIIANCVDGVLVLVHQARSRKDAVMRAVSKLQLTGANVLGFVLNGVRLETDRKYGYYE